MIGDATGARIVSLHSIRLRILKAEGVQGAFELGVGLTPLDPSENAVSQVDLW